ncbi:MAG: cob(I)yrinic acid a,c-diamide adenosyltransferase [Gammaproteobacteria bacterium]
MGHRLSRIYTRTGDEGTTGLGDGSRVAKTSRRIHALGDIDELNSLVGVLLSTSLPAAMSQQLLEIQHDLFDLGGEVSIPGATLLPASAGVRLEALIDAYNEDLPPLKEFILPSGSAATAHCHVARAVCRRAERSLVDLAAAEPVQPTALQYLNRLSDLLFVLARVIARRDGGSEVMWDRRRFTGP